MDPLTLDERMNLLSLATCVLDTGGGIALLEAFALKVPVVGVCTGGEGGETWENLGCAVNRVVGGDAEKYSTAKNLQSLATVASTIGLSAGIRRSVVSRLSAAKDEGILDNIVQTIGSTTGGEDVATFLYRVGVGHARDRAERVKRETVDSLQ